MGLSDAEFFLILIALINYYNSLRNRHYLSRQALVSPALSPWNHLLCHGDDRSFLNLTGFSRRTFMELEAIIFCDAIRFPSNSLLGKRRGRPSIVDERCKLGILLFYLGSKMTIKHLSMIFGTTPTCTSDIINEVLELVIENLKNNEHAAVKFPKDEETKRYYAHLVNLREPRVRNVIGFVDGLAIPIQCSSDVEAQSTYYNGYHHDTMCNNVLAFAPTGKIIFAALNYPGSWHDNQVCFELVALVLETIGEFAMCVDQGFKRSGELRDKFVGPMSEKTRRNLDPTLRDALLELHALYVSLRQASEWGMRALQGTFSRLKSRLTSDKEKRFKIIFAVVLLHNFRTEFMGLNQIATVFNPHYEQYISLVNYDRIARYYQTIEE